MTNPRTNAEWQDAVDAAHGALTLHAARLYGLVTGGPEVNVERCEAILAGGAQRGIMPAPNAIHRFMEGILKSQGGDDETAKI